jgi:hypothetical protein
VKAGDTVTVQGEGGAVFDLDVPADGTGRRELFDAQVADGRLQVLAEPDPEPEVKVDPGAVPDGTINDVIDWVRGAPDGDEPTDGYQDRARQALDAETVSRENPRSTLVDALEQIAGGS